MTFGYIGYIWTLLGCAFLMVLFGGSAVVLYGVSRRHRETRGASKFSVESVAPRERAPRGPTGVPPSGPSGGGEPPDAA